MLTQLNIRNIVLIDQLSLDGETGLAALTGETGAGKSILLDALGLALGGRADAGLVRHGEEQASVTASFDLPENHPALQMAAARDIPAADGLILRRTLGKDGRSKAYVNDAPVTVQFMKEIGAELVEIHGQFETQGLLDPETHRATLDDYAGLRAEVNALKTLWQAWKGARDKLDEARRDIEATKLQEEYLKFTVAELERIDPREGEEDILAKKRQMLLAREKMSEAFDTASALIEGDGGMQTLLGRLQLALEKLAAGAEETQIKPLLESLGRAKSEIEDIGWQVDRLRSGADAPGDNLEKIEDRYFALRELAKKHRTTSDALPQVLAELSQKLRLITHQEDTLADMQKAVRDARTAYVEAAQKISARRAKAADKLGKAVNAELPDLKLDKARFAIESKPHADESRFGPEGIDHVQFMVSTNPQMPAGPLHKIASGGELSRFMLALKVILAETGSVPTLIFDEADSGIGGATADAVGERLQRLARKYQVLAVTHSPQVAARAAHHWHVAKSGAPAPAKGKTKAAGMVMTRITPLRGMDEREEEIARMLSGAEITREARAQAARLLEKNLASSHAA